MKKENRLWAYYLLGLGPISWLESNHECQPRPDILIVPVLTCKTDKAISEEQWIMIFLQDLGLPKILLVTYSCDNERDFTWLESIIHEHCILAELMSLLMASFHTIWQTFAELIWCKTSYFPSPALSKWGYCGYSNSASKIPAVMSVRKNPRWFLSSRYDR